MIEVKVTKGTAYVWDPDDWLTLRRDHRILGALDGPVGNGLSGRVRWNLPMRLSIVEVQYLVAKGIVTTIHAPILQVDNTDVEPGTASRIEQQRKEQQLLQYQRKRKEEIENYADRMLDGKRRKGKIGNVEAAAFIDKELAKITKTPCDMYQMDFSDPWFCDSDYVPFGFPIPETYVEKLKLRVFEDFHFTKKYWVSPGMKFGGDFLAYPGDPRNFHAEFIIMCPDKETQFMESVATQSRLATTVKKTLLVATLDEQTDELMYYVSSTPGSNI